MRKVLLLLYIFTIFLGSKAGAQDIRLTLKDAVDTALRENLALKTEGLNVSSARADVLSREGEFDTIFNTTGYQAYQRLETPNLFIPSLTIDSVWSIGFMGKYYTGTQYDLQWRSERLKTNFPAEFQPVNPYYSSDLVLTVTQPLLKNRGMSVQKASLDVAKGNVKISGYQERRRAEQIALQTAQAYWDLYFRIRDIEVARLGLKSAESILKEVKEKIKVGALAPVEVYQSEADVYGRREELIAAEKSLMDAEDSIRRLLNLSDWTSPIVPLEEPAAQKTGVAEEPMADIFARRPDHKAALVSLRNAVTAKRFYRNQLLPDLSFIGQAGLDGQRGNYSDAISDMGSARYNDWQLGVGLKIPLENRSAKGQYQKAVYEEEKAKINLADLEQGIRSEVREARRGVQAAREALDAAEKKAFATKKRFDAERARFSVGLAILNAVIRFEYDYSRSQSDQYRALASYAYSVMKLEQVSGTILKRFKP